MHITFTAPLWMWNGKGAWYFITLPEDYSGIIKLAVPRRGWGSVRVKAQIGESAWNTSIFPDTKRNAYLLPVKADIRKAENLSQGDDVTVTLWVDV